MDCFERDIADTVYRCRIRLVGTKFRRVGAGWVVCGILLYFSIRVLQRKQERKDRLIKKTD